MHATVDNLVQLYYLYAVQEIMCIAYYKLRIGVLLFVQELTHGVVYLSRFRVGTRKIPDLEPEYTR